MSESGDSAPPPRRRRASDLVHGTDFVVCAVLLAFAAWAYYLTTGFEEVSQLFAQDVPPEFLPRLLLPLDLSYDHRVIDGAEAARFVAHLARLLGDVRRLLL